MLFRIAARLGRTVDELVDGNAACTALTYSEFVEWCAYFGLENQQGAPADDPRCPFKPGDPDYSTWMAFREVGGG